MIPRFFHPVVSLHGGSYHPASHTVAVFFTWSDAVDFINATTDRELYLGDGGYDNRVSGYRPDTADLQLTECRPDPLLKRRAA